MSKQNYDSLEELLSDLHQDIVRAFDDKIDDKVKDVYREEVGIMYSEYTPKEYERRMEFGNEANWDSQVDITDNGVSYTLTNEAQTALPSPYRLDEHIEEGIYNWTNMVPARPVYQRTEDKAVEVVENELSNELNSKGW